MAAGSGVAAAGASLAGCTAPPAADPLGPAAHGLPTPTPGRDRFARMPSSFNRRLTEETPTTPLSVLAGSLPAGLAGHVLFQSLALLDGDAGFSGDPLVWRLDLDGTVPQVTSRILRTADYLLGRAFADTPYRFESHGMMRMGPLGIQNQTNTALVALDGNRLLATIDGGRPWELDPATLRPVSPAGRLVDYRPMLELRDLNRFLCPMTITSAHPPYDPQTGEYYGVSLSMVPLAGMDYCEVLCWDGAGPMKRVPLYTADGRPVWISQSAHQMCLSRDHLVIVDASATIEFAKLLNPPNSWAAGQFAVPRPDTHLYIVDRDELRSTTGRAIARRAVIPRESGHLMVDHDNEPGRIVVHSAHTSALDVAEWVQPYDVHPATGLRSRRDLVDAPTPVSYDLGVVGRYEIDTRTGRVLDQHAFSGDWTWGTGGLTARNPLTPVATAGDVFHANSGLPTDLAVQRVHNGFLGYPHRLVPDAELPWAGVPSSLVRYDHDAGRVADGWFYPGDHFGWSPTFVPRDGRATGSTDGWIVTVVYCPTDGPAADPSAGPSARGSSGSGTELWVFDAANLAAGPVARLGGPGLRIPLALHSVWLDSLATSRPDTRVDVAAELTERAATWVLDPQVASVVRNDVVPAYESEVA
jgi:carotenoid cleavage dioxygenase-like enzyme